MGRRKLMGRSSTRAGSLAIASLLGVLVCAVPGLGLVQAATLNDRAQQRIRAATLEVVQHKPPDGAVQYERPLPLDLIPYQQRVDDYRSIGTAFAIGPNRYVTAAHVLIVGLGSQFGPPALRDAAGHVYAIDQVLKYSNREDYAVFSLQTPPQRVQPLQPGRHPAPNDTVFAVGNALGEGIVIRDGVYTSDTPEELNGDWKWLRFSAAASPGNSGGPLVDQRGQVIGVVLRKTEAENLNYALSISQVLSDPDGVGRQEARFAMKLPVIPDVAETTEIHERFNLPLSLPEFYRTVLQISETHLQQAQARLLADNAARLFPNGAGSDQLLHRAPGSPFPRLMHDGQDGVWVIDAVNPSVSQLDANGFMRISHDMIRLRAPDNVSLSQLYGDSKLLMDLVLKGTPLQRKVGDEQVRVTSLGPAQDLGTYTDSHGRTWQLRSWPVPFADLMLSAMCLPTPEGYDILLLPAQSGFRDMLLQQQEVFTNYLYLTMTGTLARWREYLALRGIQPRVFDNFKLDIAPDQYVRYQSQRFQLQVTPDLVKLGQDSVLGIDFGFYRDHGAVVWDVAGLSVQQSQQQGNAVAVTRESTPEASLPQNFQSTWSKLQQREFPFNATVFTTNGSSRIRTVAETGESDAQAGQDETQTGHSDARTGHGDTQGAQGGGAQAVQGGAYGSQVRYVLTVVAEGNQPQALMSQKLTLLQRSFKALEQ